MQISKNLLDAIELESNKLNINVLIENAQKVSNRYRNESGNDKVLLSKNDEAIAYAVSRMPATYASVSSAMEKLTLTLKEKPKTLIDIGAGTGSGTWATDDIFDFDRITCAEREEAMINVGIDLMKSNENLLKKTNWVRKDLVIDDIKEKADLVLSSYVLNEMTEERRLQVLERLWNATNDLLVIIEPGTPVCYRFMQNIKDKIVNLGGNVLAPCLNNDDCKMIASDWCNFMVRVPRTKMHRLSKNGEAPFLDEKFTYMVFSKKQQNDLKSMRILRHPDIRSGHIVFNVCDGEKIKNVTISRKDGEAYKKAKKLESGDLLDT